MIIVILILVACIFLNTWGKNIEEADRRAAESSKED